MKRLGFKAEFQADILSGKKTATIRAKNRGLMVGDIVAAVSGINGKPDFLTPADQGFATIRITKVALLRWGNVTDAHLARTLADRAWYEAHIPGLNEDYPLYFYGFKVDG